VNDKNTFKRLRDPTLLDPLKKLLKIKTWGSKWKKQIDKTSWQWANANIDKESFTLLKQIVHITKEDVEDYHLVMFTHAMDFFQERASLKKSIPEHFFMSLLNGLLTEDLVTLGNFLSTKFMELSRQLYATPGKRAWVP
jgi:hypothetical protein